jgi:hypothetical protein
MTPQLLQLQLDLKIQERFQLKIEVHLLALTIVHNLKTCEVELLTVLINLGNITKTFLQYRLKIQVRPSVDHDKFGTHKSHKAHTALKSLTDLHRYVHSVNNHE